MILFVYINNSDVLFNQFLDNLNYSSVYLCNIIFIEKLSHNTLLGGRQSSEL